MAGRGIGFPFLQIRKTVQDLGLGKATNRWVPTRSQSCEPVRPCSKVRTPWTSSRPSKLKMVGESLQLHLPDGQGTRSLKDFVRAGGSPVIPCTHASHLQQSPVGLPGIKICHIKHCLRSLWRRCLASAARKTASEARGWSGVCLTCFSPAHCPFPLHSMCLPMLGFPLQPHPPISCCRETAGVGVRGCCCSGSPTTELGII